ncbi:YjzC family protein [Virgibacillus halophilus]|uniref:YjzC family protein n=1 Tax=Tigheibacillus halophilus TaxID=361280 RepID=A0ABU5CCB3_9BACI|nr:YjzC family protein [Virgibacillus halophilus]
MGEFTHYRFGQKVPNNGVYREIGETGSNVKNPKMIRLRAGDRFPQNSNHDRVWAYEKNE